MPPASRASRRAIPPPGGTMTTTAGPTCTSRMTTGSRTSSTTTTRTARSPTWWTRSCPTRRSTRWVRTWATTFTDVVDQVLPHTSFYSMGSDLGDVNNDGLIDLLVADMATTTHVKDQNSTAESRERDEETDNSPAAQKLHRSALFLNTGLGRCLEAAYLAGISNTNWTWSPRLEDLDNDGRLDLFVTNGFNRDPNPDVNSSASHVETAADRIKVLYNISEERRVGK